MSAFSIPTSIAGELTEYRADRGGGREPLIRSSAFTFSETLLPFLVLEAAFLLLTGEQGFSPTFGLAVCSVLTFFLTRGGGFPPH